MIGSLASQRPDMPWRVTRSADMPMCLRLESVEGCEKESLAPYVDRVAEAI